MILVQLTWLLAESLDLPIMFKKKLSHMDGRSCRHMLRLPF